MSNKIPSTNELNAISKEYKDTQSEYLKEMRIDLYTAQQIGILGDRAIILIKSEFQDKLQREIKQRQERLKDQKPSKKIIFVQSRELELEEGKVAIRGLIELREKEHKFIMWIFAFTLVMSAIYIGSCYSVIKYDKDRNIIETLKVQVPVQTFIGGFIAVLGIIISLWGCGSCWKGFIAQDRQIYKETILKYKMKDNLLQDKQPNDALKIAEKEQVQKIDKDLKLD